MAALTLKLAGLLTMVGLLCLLTPSLYAGYQNYSGVCLLEGRILDHDEFILRLAEQVNQMKDLRFDNSSANVKNEGVIPIPYVSASEFLMFNPDCCVISERSKLETGFSYFLDKIQGNFGYLARAKYMARYRDAAGEVQQTFADYTGIVDNCGKITQR